MTSTALATFDISQLPATKMGSTRGLKKMAANNAFLRRIQLYSKGAAIDKRLIQPGTFGVPVSDSKIITLGESVDVIPFAIRTKAVDFAGKETATYYDDQSPEFIDVIDRADNQKNSKCMYGQSFLVYERTTGEFYEWFTGSKSQRADAEGIYEYLPLSQGDIDIMAEDGQDVEGLEATPPSACTLSARHVEWKDFSWYSFNVDECQTPFTQQPELTEVVAQVQKFMNPSTKDVEDSVGRDR